MRNIKFSRRSLLRGMGYGTVLCSGISKNLYAQVGSGKITRFAAFGYANGSHPDSAPTGMGEAFVLKPHMAPLEPVRKDIVVLRGMTLERGSGNSHKSTSFSIFGLGAPTSIDQVIADFVKSTTPLASLEYSIGTTTGGGGVIPGLSQRSGSFLPGVRTPVAAYQRIAERVTGNAPVPMGGAPMTSAPGAEQALMRRKTLLDYVKSDVDTFRSRLGGAEKAKLDFYTESLRELERGLGNVSMGGMGGDKPIAPTAACSKIPAPGDTFMTNTKVNDMPTHNPLYLDVIAMAFACNVTRVATAMWGGGQSDESVKVDNVNMGNWHSTSHNDPKGSGGQQMINMQAFMAKQLLYFTQKLKMYADGMGSLLDNTAAVLTTQNGCSTQVAFAPMDHPKQNSPLIVAGSCGGAWKTGRVIDANGRNHNDVYLSIAQAMGMKVDSVGMASWCKGPLLT
jgi:hypothetical protein